MALVFNTPKTAINTTTRDMQNLSSDCPPCPEVNLTTADVEYTENGEYTVTPEEGYDGLTQVDITVNIPSDVRNQDKLVTPTTSYQTITADSGYSGIGTVDVLPVTSSIDANITAGNIKKDVSILGVTGTVTEGITPTGNINITNTNSTDVTNYATAQVVDANLTAGNIKSGTTILGVQGSYDPQPDLETKTVTYTANDTYTITPTAGKDGMSSVEVTVNVTGSNCPDWSSIGWDCSDVTASGITGDVAVTAALLENYDPTDTSSANMQYWANKTNMIYAPSVDVWEANNTDAVVTGFFQGDTKLTNLPNLKFVGYTRTNPTEYVHPYCAYMFKGCTSLETVNLDLSSEDPQSSGYVKGAQSMFEGCSSLRNVSLTNTNGLTKCAYMFSGCTNLTNISLFDTSNVTTMDNMFSQCKSLQTIPLFNTSNVTSFYNIFVGCTALTAIPQFNTSSGTNFSSLFGNGFVTLNITEFPTWDLSKAENVKNMFGAGSLTASSLTTLGGFTNVGKAFKSTDPAANHLFDLSLRSTVSLTKQSIMNVINNLAAPDDANCTDATLKLAASSYALLDASDIAIATAKNWNVTSA